MSADNPVIGRAPCPLKCGKEMLVSLSAASQLSYGICKACKLQIFPRGERSDSLLRAMITAPEVEPTPKPAPKPAKEEAAGDSWDPFK